MCKTPKPIAINKLPYVVGRKNASVPTAIKHQPIIGTALTENEPPVTTDAPYKSSQIGIIISNIPNRQSPSVITTPQIIAGREFMTNFFDGAEINGKFDNFDFCHIANIPIANAKHASNSHVISQTRMLVCECAMYAATHAVTPINIPP